MQFPWQRLMQPVMQLADRRHSPSHFLLIFGAVDAAIGSFYDRGPLLTFGVAIVGSALTWRWRRIQRSRPRLPPSSLSPLHLGRFTPKFK